MWSERASPTFLIVVVASIVAHVALLSLLPASAPTVEPHVSTIVQIEAMTPPAPPPPAPKLETVVPIDDAAPPPPSPAARPLAARRPVAPPRQVATAEPTVEPPTGPDAPVEFSGVTLSNEGASWSSPTGNGAPMTGPIAAAEPVARTGPVRRGPSGTSTERVVAVGDLSRPPKAPDLDRALATNYPSDARRAGTTGKAIVQARILADGTVGTIRVVSESAAGFGAACKRTLTGSRWQAPLDARSEPVITDVSYTCTFAVAR